jgi:hypothetical protein
MCSSLLAGTSSLRRMGCVLLLLSDTLVLRAFFMMSLITGIGKIVPAGKGWSENSPPPWYNFYESICKQIFMIRKLKSGQYRIYSRKKDAKTNKRKNLGTFDSIEAAKKHEKAIQYFKHA